MITGHVRPYNPPELAESDEIRMAFQSVLDEEQRLSVIESKMVSLKTEKSFAETRLARAWDAVKAIMDANGVIEAKYKALDGFDYKICYTTPRMSLNVDVNAVPDEFCVVERKAKLREINEYLKNHTKAIPNWASYEMGTPKLTWKLIKHTGE